MGELILAEQGTASVPASNSISIYDDGTGGLYKSTDDPSGLTSIGEYNIYRLQANGTGIGAAIADFYGPSAAISTGTGGVYSLEFFGYFSKGTAGTLTYTLTTTATTTNMVAYYVHSAGTGLGVATSPVSAGVVTQTGSVVSLPATPSLTASTNHSVYVNCLLENNTSTNVRLRVAGSLGTIIPLRGSYYTCRRLSNGTSVGTFVA